MGSSNALEPRGLYSSIQWSVGKRTMNSFYPLQEAKEKILDPLLPQVGLGGRTNHMTQLFKPYLRVFFCLGLNSGCFLIWRVAQFTTNERKFKSSHECNQEDSSLSCKLSCKGHGGFTHLTILLSHKSCLCWEAKCLWSKNLRLHKYFLGTFRAFWKQNQHIRSLAHWTSYFRAKFLESEWIITLKREKLSSGHGGRVPQIYTMALVKRPQINFFWKKRCLRQADANLFADVGRWFWHSGKGMAFTPQLHCWPLNPGPGRVITQP